MKRLHTVREVEEDRQSTEPVGANRQPNHRSELREVERLKITDLWDWRCHRVLSACFH